MFYLNYLDQTDSSIKNSKTVHIMKYDKLLINYNLNLINLHGGIWMKMNANLPIDAISFDIESNFFTIRNILPYSQDIAYETRSNKCFLYYFRATIDLSKNKYFTSELRNQKLFYKFKPIFRVDTIEDYQIKFQNQTVADTFLDEIRSAETKQDFLILNNTYDLTPKSEPIKKFDSISDYAFSVINEKYDPKRPIFSLFNFNYIPQFLVKCKQIKLTISVEGLINEQLIEIENPKLVKTNNSYHILFDKFYWLDKKNKKIVASVGEHTGLFIDADSQIKVELNIIVATEWNFKFVNFTSSHDFNKQEIETFKNAMKILSDKKTIEKGGDVYELRSETRF